MRETLFSGPRAPASSGRSRANSALTLLATGVLLCLAAANVTTRATWNELEDGVLWSPRPEGVIAAEVAAGTPAMAAGIRAGDLLLAIDGRPIESPAAIVDVLHGGRTDAVLTYTLLRLGDKQLVEVKLAPIPRGNRALYFILAAIGVFTLLVGTAVRLRRPHDQATLHFFWTCLAFFGMLAFSFSGRFDRLDWFFYWADAISVLLLAPLFLHFTTVFPDRGMARGGKIVGTFVTPALYLPAILLGLTRVVAVRRAAGDTAQYIGLIQALDRFDPLYLSIYLLAGVAILVRALWLVRSGTARRQLRWIVWGTTLGAVPFACAYAIPWAAGLKPTLPMELSVIPLSLIPLAFASAIVRYRLMDVEVIVKRGLVWTAAVVAILSIYTVLLRFAGRIFLDDSQQYNTVIAMLATLVVVLLSSPLKNAIQNALDRAFYRDRYDYRRALVGFARDLNSDLDLDRLSERLISRVVETLLIDRIGLMLATDESHDFETIRSIGFDAPLPRLSRASGLGGRLEAGRMLRLDDPKWANRFAAEEVQEWRRAGLHYFVPCVAKERTIAVLALGQKASGEPLNSEDLSLLAAVAGQIATALENGRLYRQLTVKADELERLREFNENIVESLDDGLVVVDLDDRAVSWNRALEQLYGICRSSAIGRKLDELFANSFVDALRAARRDSPAGATLYRVPLRTRKEAADQQLLVNVTTVPLTTVGVEPPSISGTIIILEDVTARARLEEQLQISDKMASIGVLAAGVAHEVNTPLTGISSFTQMLLEGADPQDPKTQVLQKIERQTFRAAKIINGLLNLSRQSGPGTGEQVRVDVNGIINDVLTLFEHQLEVAKIKIRRELCVPSPIVSGAEHKLQQVFLNLILNARDAMPKGGWLSITSRIDGDQATVEIADTGSGIPTEHLSRIYDPFFTTKASGKGTGLGLSITYGIVREHDGALTCDSVLGQGTRFTLSLPLARLAPQRAGSVSH